MKSRRAKSGKPSLRRFLGSTERRYGRRSREDRILLYRKRSLFRTFSSQTARSIICSTGFREVREIEESDSAKPWRKGCQDHLYQGVWLWNLVPGKRNQAVYPELHPCKQDLRYRRKSRKPAPAATEAGSCNPWGLLTVHKLLAECPEHLGFHSLLLWNFHFWFAVLTAHFFRDVFHIKVDIFPANRAGKAFFSFVLVHMILLSLRICNKYNKWMENGKGLQKIVYKLFT